MEIANTICVIEDDEGLLYLVTEKIKRKGYKVVGFCNGSSAIGYIVSAQSVETPEPAALIVDQNLPDMKAKEIISILKDKGIKIPFIIITGFGDERLAVEMMKLGAQDYLIKDSEFLDLLPLAVEQMMTSIEKDNALREAEIKLKESEERYHAFINASNDMIFVKDSDCRYIIANNSIASFFNVTPEDMLGKTDRELSNHNLIAPCESSDKKALLSFSPFTVEEKLGNKVFETTKFPIVLNNNQKVIGGIIRDITERKTSEQILLKSKRQLQSFLQIGQSMTSTFDQELLFQLIVDNAISAMDLDSGAIYLLVNKENIILKATFPALPPDFPEEYRLACLEHHPNIQRVFETREYLYIPDTKEADLSEYEKEIIQIRNLRSNLYLPINLREKTIGVLILSSIDKKYLFDQEEIELLLGFANQTAQIIDNISNFERLKKYAAELEQQIAERVRTEEKLISLYDETNRMNRLMSGRESRILELKKEVNKLSEQLNQGIVYNSTEDLR